MKHITLRAAAVLAAVLVLCGSVTALAAESPSPVPTSDAVGALHDGAPPVYPGTETVTPAPTDTEYSAEPPFSFVTPTPEPTAEPEPVVPMLYPADVQGVLENGIRWIVKTYELSDAENPEGIARDGFTQDGWSYVLTDITKKETATADVRERIEVVTVNTETKDMATIIAQIAPTLEYTDEDGYTGILDLDITTMLVETAGTKTNSYTVSATREYPHLSSNDTSLLPKTITDSGKTLTLASVDWRAGNTVTVDYDVLPEYYTAIATYTATGSKTSVTGYITTVEYKGTLSKLLAGKTVYTAYFEGTPIAPPAPEPTPTPEPTPEVVESKPINPVPAAAGATAGVSLLGGVVFFFFLRKNVKVHNLKDGKYLPIGKTRVTAGTPIINLTTFANKAVSGSFILILDRLAAKQLSSKTVTINYGDRTFQHIIDSDGGEYQFEVDF